MIKRYCLVALMALAGVAIISGPILAASDKPDGKELSREQLLKKGLPVTPTIGFGPAAIDKRLSLPAAAAPTATDMRSSLPAPVPFSPRALLAGLPFPVEI